MQEPSLDPDADATVAADLSALADGTLDPKRAQTVSELIAGSPELRERYQREQRAVTILHELREDRAPHSLRLAIDARRTPKRRARLLPAGALGATVAAVVAFLVLLLPGGSPGSPSVSQAAALALRGANLSAPLLNPRRPARLQQDVEDVYFPNWIWVNWRPSGRRVDEFAGRVAVTVYYTNGSRQIAYTILEAPPLRRPGSRMTRLDGIQLQSFVSDDRLVVTWQRAGHTCVLSGSGVTVAQLAKLAAWDAGGL